MRICFISREYPPATHVGGIGTYTATAAKLLANAGHEVHVLCNGQVAEKKVVQGIIVHRLVMDNHPLPQYRFAFFIRKFAREKLPAWLDAYTWALTVARYTQKSQVLQGMQAIEFPETNGEGALINFCQVAPKTQIICRIHTSWLESNWHHPLERYLILKLQRKACEKSTQVVSPSQAMTTHYAQRILKLKTPVKVDPNPFLIWPQPIAWKQKDSRHILFVGRIEFRKGIDVLIKLLPQLADFNQKIEIRIIGAQNDPYSPMDTVVHRKFQQALIAYSPTSAHSVSLEWLGSLPHHQLPEHYDWAGILIFPSRMDNYPYVLIEALSRGCFVIGFQVGGVHEIVSPPQFGDLVFKQNPALLLQKMRKWIGQNAELLPHWEAAVAFIHERYSPDAMLRRMDVLYTGENPDSAAALSQAQTPD